MDNKGYRHAFRIRNVLYFHSNSGYVNALWFYVYTYIACLVTDQLSILQLLTCSNSCRFSILHLLPCSNSCQFSILQLLSCSNSCRFSILQLLSCSNSCRFSILQLLSCSNSCWFSILQLLSCSNSCRFSAYSEVLMIYLLTAIGLSPGGSSNVHCCGFCDEKSCDVF
jgi:hypothetical protein